MKKSIVVILLLVVIGLGLYRFVVGNHNNLVGLDEWVKQARSQVENQYQRRTDLIPNLVQTVKGFANQEFDTLTAVTEARAKATSTRVDIKDVQSMAAFQQSQGQLSSALSRLLVSIEAYPELKSDKNFLELQTQLEGTENRISTERGRYNEVVKDFNTTVRKFPTNIIAKIFGFDRAELFKAEAGAEKAPDVDFDFSGRNTQRPSETTDTTQGTVTNNQIDGAVEAVDNVE